MRKFLTVAAIALALTGCAAQSAPQAPAQPSKAVTVAPKPVQTPKVELAPAQITVETPAPVAPVDQAPLDTITAPTPVYVAPVVPVAPKALAVKETPKAVAVAPAPTPPAPVVPSIPPYTDADPVPPVVTPAPTMEACSEFETRAEDGSCVRNDFWDDQPVIIPPHAEPKPLDCDNLELGDAHAGIGLVCGLDKK